jgi:hypothetical protein
MGIWNALTIASLYAFSLEMFCSPPQSLGAYAVVF